MDNSGVRLWALPVVPFIIKANTNGVLLCPRVMFYIYGLIYYSLCAITCLIKAEIPVREEQSHKGNKSRGTQTC